MLFNEFEKNRDQVLSELQACQDRTLHTLVPTIIAVGLISIGDREYFALVTLISSFAVLFGSSLYVASLAYKIFRNGSYLQVLSEYDPAADMHSWNAALQKFNKVAKIPKIIGFETKTIAVIYLAFAGSFTLMFYGIHNLLAPILGGILVLIALQIALIPRMSATYLSHWRQVFSELEGAESGN